MSDQLCAEVPGPWLCQLRVAHGCMGAGRRQRQVNSAWALQPAYRRHPLRHVRGRSRAEDIVA